MVVYALTIGLEIHAELKTRTKMFCSSRNDPDEIRPNVNICPVCMAHPGTLPVINKEAVRAVLKVGTALGSALADYTEFDRKNYFYPDLPKGYQLSQYEYPLAVGGELAGVALTRIHLEEDTASSMHDEGSGKTVIDYNRAGVPLMELVTEPVITSAEDAGRFARELRLLLRTLGVSAANMEKGEMRVEANVSVSRDGVRGTKVEVKNLNSFNAMERAVRYETDRQTALLEEGKPVLQETRGWDEKRQATFAQRTKEGSADYRYFPDPDLPSLRLSEIEGFSEEALQQVLPELPAALRTRYAALGLQPSDVELYVTDGRFRDFFDAATRDAVPGTLRLASNYIANDLVKIVRDIEDRDSGFLGSIPLSVEYFRTIIAMITEGLLSSKAAKEVLLVSVRDGVEPREYAKKGGMLAQRDEQALARTIDAVLERNPSVVSAYKKGKTAALEYLLGQGMKELHGGADPAVLRSLLQKRLQSYPR